MKSSFRESKMFFANRAKNVEINKNVTVAKINVSTVYSKSYSNVHCVNANFYRT